MKPTYKILFSALGIFLGMAVLVVLIIVPEPKVNLLIMLLALGMTSQGISLIDQLGEKEEKHQQDN